MRVDVHGEGGTAGVANEDLAGVVVPAGGLGGAVVVLDGVTPPRDGVTGCVHDVPWFTARLGGALQELLAARAGSLREALADAVARTAAAHGPGCDLGHVRTPQATVAMARWDDDRVEYLVLSDAALLVEGADGEVSPVLDRRLDQLPDRIRKQRAAVRALPEGSPEREAAGREYARAVEALRNADGGFYTAAADPRVAAKAVAGVLPRSEVTAFAALTDGATRYTEVFRLGDWAELLAVLRKEGPAQLIARVRAAENADPDRTAHPRGKTHDDATAVYVEL
ncbi:protein phosphatase 2C domain-containing protein [Streptomyces sp. NPDC051940]|uniref:protein phosphatase 2C domain-containing protein n=1 Tax=Streptomyces sp. NPDC051940 TaxID=3155675 RepID=UPI00342A95F3